MIRNFIAVALLALMSFGAMAQNSVKVDGLTEEQVLQLQLEAAKLRDSRSTEITAEKISEYTLVGEQVAQAIIAVAKELGKTVDDVLHTTIGKLVVVLVIWKVAGEDIMGFLVAGLWCVTMIPLWTYYFRKFCVNYEYEYHANGKVASKRRHDASDNAVAIFIIAALIIVVVPMLMAFA